MLKNFFTFGLLAAGLLIAPTAAIADQVAGSESITNQSSVNKGVGNTTGQSSITNTVQEQLKKSGVGTYNRGGNQTAGSNSVTDQYGVNVGRDNVTGQTSETNTIQKQYQQRKGGYRY
ncbi:hypothetical protein [Iningainema tapete]|uniref:Uncharacterized protein n=1 Tax=Iningainema tapete BLCC-T55 TaxID=2748662 RepID=A0A8J6XI34_9CYAN|nr:hypothetical protein [Iningainema tapete]MBD2773142.1 hypothetical protein [Iningainema tapete BLCC-T55]